MRIILGIYISIQVHKFTSYLPHCIIQEIISSTRPSGGGTAGLLDKKHYSLLKKQLRGQICFFLKASFKSEIMAQIQRILCTIPYNPNAFLGALEQCSKFA